MREGPGARMLAVGPTAHQRSSKSSGLQSRWLRWVPAVLPCSNGVLSLGPPPVVGGGVDLRRGHRMKVLIRDKRVRTTAHSLSSPF